MLSSRAFKSSPAQRGSTGCSRPFTTARIRARTPFTWHRPLPFVRAADEEAAAAVDAAADAAAATSVPAAAAYDSEPEELYCEASGPVAELVLSLLLSTTLIFIPLTLASIGRKLWIKHRFTNKRISVINTSPLFKRQVDVSYREVREVRTAPRAFGLWGDMVIFLRDGSRLEIPGLENYQDIKRYIESKVPSNVM